MARKNSRNRRRVVQSELPSEKPKPSKDWAVELGRARHYLERSKRKINGFS